MCNAYGYLAPIDKLIDSFRQLDLPLRFDDGRVPNLQPRDLIRPTDPAPILRARNPGEGAAAGLELVELRWWLIPFFHRGPVKAWKAMTTNARAETIATTPAYREAYARRRCLVPATHFFEWTPLDPAKPKGLKQRWRVTAPGQEVFYFPGLWEQSRPSDHDDPLQSFTLATCSAGEDVSPYHIRQPVILDAAAGAQWLDLSGPGEAQLRPPPAGTLTFTAD
ncbi:MAG: SOS response-associated peptidase [Phenylobacterium sp.]|uniref:SOS response-associated peptidase n=1 Tax=Phenylobacterium sp. TaxID=1871053 RepID=UPI0027326B7C|nr:SOS response-associated peptidase [Phenylobacterium sp.]MDP3173640.1 SOS response-associated peptidase [Phenylobacterium sp.]